MVVLVLTACPAGLRGHLTRWLMEISPGVFVGQVTTRVRELMWLRVLELCKDGKAIMVHPSNNEQGLEYRFHRHDWLPEDFDGIWLMRRPADPDRTPALRPGWSKASQVRRARRTK
ncbi:MAG: type I-E CRISPR-associated endoribonuclease Cas2e [Micrococcales bacterium]|nr:type I-E CRISPR-associated endoribonuclease Cas2e [Micrococcales bacterium]